MTKHPKTCNDCVYFDYSCSRQHRMQTQPGSGACVYNLHLVNYNDPVCEDFEEDEDEPSM